MMSNLQPVYPARVNGNEIWLFCADCNRKTLSGETFADISTKPGTYVCIKCMFTFRLWNHGRINSALIARDKRERDSQSE